MTYDNGNRYIVDLDASGKVRLEIIMPLEAVGKLYLKRNTGQFSGKCLKDWDFLLKLWTDLTFLPVLLDMVKLPEFK